MNAFFDRLMVHIPNGYTTDAQPISSLMLTGIGNVTIEGDRLYVATSTQNATIDLHNQSVSQIVSQLPSGVTGTVIQNGMAELLMLPSQADSATLPVTLELPSNNLWFVVGAMARNLESRKRSLLNQVGQLNAAVAEGKLLDWWGATLGVERVPSEPDILYAQRIIGLKFEPNVNNLAMENFFAKLGYTTTVTDASYGSFDVDVTLPTSPASGFTYSLSDLQTALTILKAAGVAATIVLQGALTDTVKLSDSLSYTLNNTAWTVGNVTVGQFNV